MMVSTEVRVAKPRTRHERWEQARRVLSESLTSFFREDSLTISASIAYHSLLAIFPLMLLLLGFSGAYIRRHELSGHLAMVMERYLPFKSDIIIQNLVSISHAYGRITLASFLLLLWSSAGVFLPLEKALNRAWDVEKGRGWWRSHLLALEMAITFGLLILLSTVLVGINVYVHSWLRRWIAQPLLAPAELAYHLTMVGATFVITLSMFIILFERLPNRPMHFRQVLPSALFTALFWEAARSLFTLLLPRFNYRHVYGSIGALVALMTWAYISSAVMLFGAQVSRALYRTLKVPSPGSAASPAPPAIESARKAM